MSGVTKKLMSASGGAAGPAMIEDVFSTYLFTPNTAGDFPISNGIDLAGEGGLVWMKRRDLAALHMLHDTERGVAGGLLRSDSTNSEALANVYLGAFNSDGFTPKDLQSQSMVSWTFRKAPRFFDVVTYTGDGTGTRQLSHNLGTTVGSVFVKTTSVSNPWIVWHRGMSSEATLKDYYLQLNTTDSIANTFGNIWGSTNNVTDSTFQLGTNINQSGVQYVAYLFAHDPLGPSGDGSDGLIACGSYTGTGAAGNFIDLGWEPQFVIRKSATGESDWFLQDSMRSMSYSDYAWVFTNSSLAESGGALDGGTLAAAPTGFIVNNAGSGNTAGQTFIYIAIRRGPMRAPTSGTEVFKPSYGLSASNSEIVNAGFPIDLNWRENVTGGVNVFLQDRMRGFNNFLTSNTTGAEFASTVYFGTQNGIAVTTTANLSSWINWSFRRAPEFFDVVAYAGNGVAGRTVPHNLGVAPEMMIVKSRGDAESWCVYHAGVPTPEQNYLYLNENSTLNPNANTIRYWNHTLPASTEFTLGDEDRVNQLADTYIAYLFATLAGVSKVGSYTGNGSSQTINCGFTTGARLVLIKATSTTGDWLIADTARGIVAGNDPYLELNTTNAEVTSEDWLDPDSSGFIVNEVAGSNANTSGVSYIYLAIS